MRISSIAVMGLKPRVSRTDITALTPVELILIYATVTEIAAALFRFCWVRLLPGWKLCANYNSFFPSPEACHS